MTGCFFVAFWIAKKSPQNENSPIDPGKDERAKAMGKGREGDKPLSRNWEDWVLEEDSASTRPEARRPRRIKKYDHVRKISFFQTIFHFSSFFYFFLFTFPIPVFPPKKYIPFLIMPGLRSYTPKINNFYARNY